MSKSFDPDSHWRLLEKFRNYRIKNPPSCQLPTYFPVAFRLSVLPFIFQALCYYQLGHSGSVPGLILFPLYIIDIFKVILDDTPFLLADEIKMVYSFEVGSFNSLLALINEDLEALDNWCSKWLMNFSADKIYLTTCKCRVPPGSL